jgi:hypothetical protein
MVRNSKEHGKKHSILIVSTEENQSADTHGWHAFHCIRECRSMVWR